MVKKFGVLTAGGDTPGLNAALRGLSKAARNTSDIQLIGFYDGFNGLLNDRTINLDKSALSGILTMGGTVLGTSRDKPNRMPVDGRMVDMTDAMVETYRRHNLDGLVCIGGGGTQKNAYRLLEKGLNIITLPKSIDNDVAMTDTSLGFDTALGIGTEAIDRLHSTADSHHRIIVVELMGHNAGWLTLGSGIAGGADVILLPEIPYDVHKVAEAITERYRGGKRFSVVAVSEGAMTIDDHLQYQQLVNLKTAVRDKEDKEELELQMLEFQSGQSSRTVRLAKQLGTLTGLETRMTILGYVQRGGTPSATDRLLATLLGSAAITYIRAGAQGVMIAIQNQKTAPVPLVDVVDRRKTVPLDDPWVEAARRVGTCMGD